MSKFSFQRVCSFILVNMIINPGSYTAAPLLRSTLPSGPFVGPERSLENCRHGTGRAEVRCARIRRWMQRSEMNV